ncbi:DUF6889 family protein [Komagataeibacter oboediens]|uniref:DUF6889 family protein n=1 Tax=Komagataeibacter oboediens TaxID=65958 RepID=UPI000237EC90|nr:hypothetical protein [Komagataeibacter oboediens]
MLPDGLDFLMRPILAQMCRMESLHDHTLSLADFALMNDALDARAENEVRAHRAAENIK